MQTIINQIPQDYWNGKQTIEIGYPWITPGAMIMLEQIIKPDFKILEIGCGGSTVFYSKFCSTIYSLESSAVWAEHVKTKTSASIKVLENTEKTLAFINLLNNNYFDLISVDGARIISRLAVTKAVIPKVKTWLLLDNYDANGSENFKAPEKWKCYTFDDMHWQGKGTKILQRTV